MKKQVEKILAKTVLLVVLANVSAPSFDQLLADPFSTSAIDNASPAKEESLSWIDAAGEDYVIRTVPPPPADGSTKDQADRQAMLRAEANRTILKGKEPLSGEGPPLKLLAGAIGPHFTSKNYPVTFDFLSRVLEDANFMNSTLQAKYKRPRPGRDPSGSKDFAGSDPYGYPSRAAANSRMLVLVLAEIFPDKAVTLLQRDQAITQSQMEAGWQYPSDIVAGRAVAIALIFVLQDNPGFMADLNKAQTEVAAKAKSPPLDDKK